ncbi:hypothetical protein EPUS_02965 [Endocarpon pusillum Z07020]|uniref:C2H2-type domain-containing protein n=1 Tax=Endocarpon pusillum (strain Z07020 / HMAS-L-300199) TaxID=1263415 RepID=U1HSK6_ENDPU|nr:uncharacterized protein EPUS_02965 [Endocarpon pusillum Z07020]ERF72174.1 hypothetical protein EPUS_02965 [Endocarpon pusillum Z07020]
MGKKKRGHPDVEEILSRPWCYYCERDFDDQKVLINHQKAKHFKCERCGRRLNTAGGLSVHMSQVHKETLSAVDNALPNRAGLDIEIFGMEGIPEDIIQQHNQRVLTQYHQAEAERRVASGSAGGAGGAAAGSQPKKPKFESPADLKRRLAEHKAKLAAEQQNGGSSGGASSVPGNASFNFPGGYSQPLQQGPPFQPPGGAFVQQPPFSPPPFQNQAPYPNPQYPPQMTQTSPQPFQGPSLGGPHVGPPRPFGAGSPVQQFGFQQQQPPRIHTPPQSSAPPQRSLSGSLPPAPGLPQRPAFGAPHVNHFQMQQMHQGQIPGPPNQPVNQAAPAATLQPNSLPQPPAVQSQITQQLRSNETSLDDLILGASKQAEEAVTAQAAAETPKAVDQPSKKPPETPAGEPAEEKKDKKEKSKAAHLVYSDQETSPEEKMARMPRYAFTPEKAR